MRKNLQTLIAFIILICAFSSCDHYKRSILRTKLVTKFTHKTSKKIWKKRDFHGPNPLGHQLNKIKEDQYVDYSSGIKAVVPVANLSKYINSYAAANGMRFPQYFLMKSDELISFLKGNLSPQSPYLQAYLCTNETTGYLDLAACGTFTNTIGSQYNEYDSYIAPNSVFGNFYNPYTCSTVQDYYMEGVKPGQNPYRYSRYPGTSITSIHAGSFLISTDLASARIDTYDVHEKLPLALSFIIDSTDIGLFLNNAQYQFNSGTGKLSPNNYVVPYVQIYLAYENNDPNQMTIIIVGVDNTGNHIYFTPDKGTTLEAFNTAFPCPYCNVEPRVLNIASQ